MRITTEEVIQFTQKLEAKARETFPDAHIDAKLAPTGAYLIIMHTDNTLQSVSECYTIDPISREWIKTYGQI